MRISDWSSDVCSSDLSRGIENPDGARLRLFRLGEGATGAAEQGRGIIARCRGGDADPAAKGDDMITRHERSGERLDQFSGQKSDRKSVGEGKSVSVRVDLGGRRLSKKKKKKKN